MEATIIRSVNMCGDGKYNIVEVLLNHHGKFYRGPKLNPEANVFLKLFSCQSLQVFTECKWCSSICRLPQHKKFKLKIHRCNSFRIHIKQCEEHFFFRSIKLPSHPRRRRASLSSRQFPPHVSGENDKIHQF